MLLSFFVIVYKKNKKNYLTNKILYDIIKSRLISASRLKFGDDGESLGVPTLNFKKQKKPTFSIKKRTAFSVYMDIFYTQQSVKFI